MIKSLLIKLRRKPKVVRDQAALVAAGVFTFAIFAVWAFTIPGQFSGTGTQTAGIFSSFTSEFSDEISEYEFSNSSEDLGELLASSSILQIEPETVPASTTSVPVAATTTPVAENQRPIRITTATTTAPAAGQ